MTFLQKLICCTWLIVISISASATTVNLPASCGKDDVQFKVKSDKKHVPLAAPEEGKAIAVFTETLQGNFFSEPTVRYAIDGKWVGANRGRSYFTVELAPGSYKVCAVRQSQVGGDKEPRETDVTVAAGQTYFFDFTVIRTELGGPQLMGSGGLPGNVPDSTLKEKPTIDSVAFDVRLEKDGNGRVSTLPLSSFSLK